MRAEVSSQKAFDNPMTSAETMAALFSPSLKTTALAKMESWMPSNGLVLLRYPLIGMGTAGVILTFAVPADNGGPAAGGKHAPDMMEPVRQQANIPMDLMMEFMACYVFVFLTFTSLQEGCRFLLDLLIA
jgi:hypothetical protein